MLAVEIAVGAAVGAALLSAVIYYYLRRRERHAHEGREPLLDSDTDGLGRTAQPELPPPSIQPETPADEIRPTGGSRRAASDIHTPRGWVGTATWQSDGIPDPIPAVVPAHLVLDESVPPVPTFPVGGQPENKKAPSVLGVRELQLDHQTRANAASATPRGQCVAESLSEQQGQRATPRTVAARVDRAKAANRAARVASDRE
jgi:hypothetical protein